MRNSLIIIAILLISCVVSSTFETPVSAKAKETNKSRIQRGKTLFNDNGCLDCHMVGKKGNSDGVKLDSVGKLRTKEFLSEHLRDPESHVTKNKSAFHGDPNMMPNPNLSEKEVSLIVEYLLTLKSKS